jgi:hypothetical protein
MQKYLYPHIIVFSSYALARASAWVIMTKNYYNLEYIDHSAIRVLIAPHVIL